jgi:phosphomannomutase
MKSALVARVQTKDCRSCTRPRRTHNTPLEPETHRMDALMIGVSGLRGTVGGTLTPAVAMRMAAAFACWLKTQRPANGSHFRVVVGRDGRPSGPFVRDAVFSALAASGIETIDLDVVTTPGVAMMVKHAGADAGIVITASHNPIQWNGLKLLTRDSVAPPPAAVAEIRDYYDRECTSFVRVDQLRQPARNTETHALHTKKILDHLDVNGISGRRYKVVLDSVNGAGCVATATLLSKLGCSVVHIHNTPNGQFPHEPEPTAANLTQLAGEVAKHKAAVGFAQDPDADRLAVIDEHGTYIGEEYSLALCAKWLMSKRPGVAVTNLSTSRMLDDIAKQHGGRVVRTPVGEPNVVDAMLKENAVVGGEGNGGVIDLRIVPGRDSLVGMAYVLQLMASTGKDRLATRRRNPAVRDRQNQVRVPPRRRRPRRRRRQSRIRRRQRRRQDRHPGRHPHRLARRLGPRPPEQHRADHAHHRRGPHEGRRRSPHSPACRTW